MGASVVGFKAETRSRISRACLVRRKASLGPRMSSSKRGVAGAAIGKEVAAQQGSGCMLHDQAGFPARGKCGVSSHCTRNLAVRVGSGGEKTHSKRHMR